MKARLLIHTTGQVLKRKEENILTNNKLTIILSQK